MGDIFNFAKVGCKNLIISLLPASFSSTSSLRLRLSAPPRLEEKGSKRYRVPAVCQARAVLGWEFSRDQDTKSVPSRNLYSSGGSENENHVVQARCSRWQRAMC